MRGTDNVFINCPFDEDYQSSFRALVFTVHACGFRARCAFELDDGGEARIEKLYRIISQSRYGIHDLSRTELDKTNNLPRFNMPFELGLFLGAKRFGGPHAKKHCIIFDTQKYRPHKFISDIAGMDIHEHQDDPRQLVRHTRDWLKNVSRRTTVPSKNSVLTCYDAFTDQLPEILQSAGFPEDDLAYADFERFLIEWLRTAPLM
jgi:hypothetical protein